MRSRLKRALILVVFSVFGQSLAQASGIDLGELEKQLNSSGLKVWVHGAAVDFDQYVVTWRDPGDFFTSVDFTLVARSAALKQQLAQFHRHDLLLVKGEFADNPSPQKHIELREVQLLKKYDSGISVPPHHRIADLPADLMGKTELLGVVHAVPADGGVLVIEYKDAVVPVFVEDNTYTKDLYRGDKIRLQYRLLAHPKKPTHLLLNTGAAKPLEVIDSMVMMHGKKVTLEGILGFFPKSPQITLNVYALQQVDPNGLKRNFTLVNLEDPAVFQAIGSKLKKIWEAQQSTMEDGRNMLINRQIHLRARGTVNVVSKGQANPQIFLDSADDLELVP